MSFALLGDAIPEVGAYAPWAQFGALGILAFLVWWVAKWAVPRALAMHESVIAGMVTQHQKIQDKQAEAHREICAQMLAKFESEATECREERRELQKQAAMEREIDRKARHDLADRFQTALNQTTINLSKRNGDT